MRHYSHTTIKELCLEAYCELSFIFGNRTREQAKEAWGKLSRRERMLITAIASSVVEMIARREAQEEPGEPPPPQGGQAQ